MKLIVGLGNPGARYVGTRHNIGFAVVERVAQRWGIGLSKEKFHARFGDGCFGDEGVALLEPQTFMNRSGEAVWSAARFFRIEPEDLLVIGDDLSLPLGRLRMRGRGSSGGHHGLQDVIDRVGSTSFARLRLGIGTPQSLPAQYVLSHFTESESLVAERMVSTAAEAVECWTVHGPEATMNRFNKMVDQD